MGCNLPLLGKAVILGKSAKLMSGVPLDERDKVLASFMRASSTLPENELSRVLEEFGAKIIIDFDPGQIKTWLEAFEKAGDEEKKRLFCLAH